MTTTVSNGLNETMVAKATKRAIVEDEVLEVLVDITTAPSRPEQGVPSMHGIIVPMHDDGKCYERGEFAQHPYIPGLWIRHKEFGCENIKIGWYIDLGMDHHAREEVFLEIATETLSLRGERTGLVAIDGIEDEEDLAYIVEIGLAKAYEQGLIKHLTEHQVYTYSLLYDRANFHWLRVNVLNESADYIEED